MPLKKILPPTLCGVFDDKGKPVPFKWASKDVNFRKSNKWVEDSDRRSECRRNLTSGIQRKQFALKTCTGKRGRFL